MNTIGLVHDRPGQSPAAEATSSDRTRFGALEPHGEHCPPALPRALAGNTLVFATRPRRDLPRACFEALAARRIGLRTLSILRDETRPGWQRVTIEVEPCVDGALVEVAAELSGETVESVPCG